MSSRSQSVLRGSLSPHASTALPPDVVMMRKRLGSFMRSKPEESRGSIGSCKWGVYAFFDFDGEPIYVGQTRESLSTRVNRHLQNQRTDSVAMRILDPMEVAEVRVWPLWQLQDRAARLPAESDSALKARRKVIQQDLDQAEYTVYTDAIGSSKYQAILNEKIPPSEYGTFDTMPQSYAETLYEGMILEERSNADVRIARRAESVSRLADVARERGLVSVGLRRVLVVQAVRLAHLSAERLALVTGESLPSPTAIDSKALFGEMLPEDPATYVREDSDELDEIHEGALEAEAWRKLAQEDATLFSANEGAVSHN